MARSRASRKWQLTINNPKEKGFDHKKIKEVLALFNYIYWCMCDEIGEEGTYHTHIYAVFENAVMFNTVKNRFEIAHIEETKGSSQENREYIRKEGKWLEDEKKETNLIETFEEDGEIPLDSKKKNQLVSREVYNMIKEGFSNYDIIEAFPGYMTKIPYLEQTRQLIKSNAVKRLWRHLDITYIYGDTGTGKTRNIMEQYGYENVCRITNYKHPFDNYKGQDVLIFEEFRSSLPLPDMLNYLDGYPIDLPCRYADKVACYTKVYIITNIPLEKQYQQEQMYEIESWNSFLRRIDKILHFTYDSEFPFDKNHIIIEEIEKN